MKTRASGFIRTIGFVTLYTFFTGQVLGGHMYGANDGCDSCHNGAGGGDATASSSTSSSSSGSASGGASSCKVCNASSGGTGGGGNNGSTGGSGSGCQSCPQGMPIWEVSEPFINVFLYDEPLSYQPGLGPKISFKLTYKQREARTTYTNYLANYTGFGPNWNCSWAGYLYRNFTIGGGTTNYDGNATVVLPDGGERTFVGNGATPEFFSHGILTPTTNLDGSWKSATIVYPDASTEIYSNVVRVLPGLPPYPILYLIERHDPFGNTTKFEWFQVVYPSEIAHLLYVVDADGRTNTLSYTSGLITSVQDPFGRTATLQYDSSGRLTNITDPESLSSSFTYNSAGSITNLHTPYGNTAFEYIDNGFTVSSGPIRAVRVDDAAGGTNVYMLTQLNGLDFSSIPYPNTFPFGSTLCAGYPAYRDSFHWGPRQSVGLPADMNSYGNSDFIRARMRHWLHDTNTYSSTNADYDNGYGGVSQVLDFEVAPSPDGVNFGEATFYAYADYECPYIGTNSVPSFVGKTLPDGTTRLTQYMRDDLGRATNVIDSYSASFGATPSVRTNIYIYNGADLIAHYGPNGNLEDTYGYNGQHQLTYYTNAVGDVTSYTYDSFGRLTGTHTPAGLTTTNIYFTTGDYTNFLQTTIDLQIARTNSYTWANDLVATHTDERGMTTTNIYDNLQRLTNASDPRGTIRYLYNKLDLVKIVDRMGFTNSFGYDAVRRKIAETNALGFYTLYNYCTCGALDSMRDPVGNFTYFYYDSAGRMTNAVYPDDYSVTNGYDLLGELLWTIDSAGIAKTNWYNNQGLLYTTWNAAGQVSLLQFDIKDRPVYVTGANGVTITNTYDEIGRVLTRGYPDGGVERFGYSPRGLIAYTNQLNFTNFYAFDEAMRKTFDTNANGEVIRYTNNAASDLLSLTDGKNQTTQWKYDLFGRVTNKLDQAGTVVLKYTYDPDNRLTNRWSVAKGTTTYKYDLVGNLTNIVYPAGTSNVVFKFDSLNRLTNMVDGIGTTKFTYSASGQLLTEDGPWGNDTVTNIYSNRLRSEMDLQQPTGLWTNHFTYDFDGRLYSLTSPAGAFDYHYQDSLPSTLVQKLVLPNTSYITNGYDSNARLIFTILTKNDNTVLDAALYGYDLANQRTGFTNATGTNVLYTYDRIGQLTGANGSDDSEDRGYAYDAAWNLSYLTNSFSSNVYYPNALNEYTSMTEYSVNYNNNYDGNGNMRSFSDFNDNGYDFTYDAENRLTQVEVYYGGPSGGIMTFQYDGLGRLRITTNWDGSTTDYIYDGMRVIQERDGSNVPQVSYTRGSDLSGTMEGAGGIGGLLARSAGYSGGAWTNHNYYHADGNGNVMYLETSNQALAASYRYDAFGETIQWNGSLAFANTYQFSSKQRVQIDPQDVFAFNGIYYYGYRFYAPHLQRWLNRDPIMERGGYNLYAFALNDPIDRVDRVGLEAPLELYFMGPPITPPTRHDISQFLQALTFLGGKCKNTSPNPEWALVGGPFSDDTWVKLNPGESTGPFQDCDGMTCGGGFYKVSGLNVGDCHTPGNDCPYYKKRRWTPSNKNPKIVSPTEIQPGINSTPPGYQYAL